MQWILRSTRTPDWSWGCGAFRCDRPCTSLAPCPRTPLRSVGGSGLASAPRVRLTLPLLKVHHRNLMLPDEPLDGFDEIPRHRLHGVGGIDPIERGFTLFRRQASTAPEAAVFQN